MDINTPILDYAGIRLYWDGKDHNINNPDMKKLYYRWKEKHDIPKRIPLSDQERRQFDRDTMLLLQGRDNPKLTE